jgi:4-oxalocrotonate tautomerase family enzyme
MPTVFIYWSPVRTPQQKQRVVERVTQALVEEANARPEDVLIIFQNIEAGDAARGGHIISGPQPAIANHHHNPDESSNY